MTNHAHFIIRLLALTVLVALSLAPVTCRRETPHQPQDAAHAGAFAEITRGP